jgi:arylsulfatase A-like enzyme
VVTGAVALGALAAGVGLGASGTPARGVQAHAAARPPHVRTRGVGGAAVPARPNIVFVLTDDLTADLLPYMPNVEALARRGESFSNYFVTDSLCCPSRASILTGRYPHDTGIFTNSGPDGGFLAFRARGLERTTYATTLQAAGYRTALMGKYLNQYSPARGPYVPPGWSEWDAVGDGYPGYGYRITHDVSVSHRGFRPRDYLTNVLARRGLGFIGRSAAAGTPFMLNVWTFAPHTPAVPAPQDANRFAGVTAPRDPSFDEADMSDKPPWLRDHPPLGASQIARIDEAFRQRVRSVQAVDRMVGRIEQRLRAAGIARSTYIVFSSDNGYHLGQHRLTPGKLTAYDTDVRVPLIVTGPGVPQGRTVDAMTENTDLCPTFAELGRAPPPPHADGRSLVPFLRGQHPSDWRDAVLIEHRGNVDSPDDPDLPPAGSGNPPSYEALRSKDALYVEYADGERELYDLKTDPYELQNLAATASPLQLDELSSALAAMEACHGQLQCAQAQRLPGGAGFS